MLRVTIELWPGGFRSQARVIATADIANISELADLSDYAVSATEGQNPIAKTHPWSGQGEVLQHDRKASVWGLVAKVASWAAEERLKTSK
jgi:hypothetical protein